MEINEIIQTCLGGLGAIGFALLFRVTGKKLAAVGIGGCISWIVYLLVWNAYDDKALAILASTITVGILAEILARVMKTPVIVLLVPMLIPLIPGSDLYYTTSYLVRGQAAECTETLNLLAWEAGAIAFGIILVTCMVQVIQVVQTEIRMNKE